jgi:adenine/guanine phosphoribosyltransferase-like PRPP-binding protein
MTNFELPWMVELVVAVVGLASAGIFLAHMIAEYRAE